MNKNRIILILVIFAVCFIIAGIYFYDRKEKSNTQLKVDSALPPMSLYPDNTQSDSGVKNVAAAEPVGSISERSLLKKGSSSDEFMSQSAGFKSDVRFESGHSEGKTIILPVRLPPGSYQKIKTHKEKQFVEEQNDYLHSKRWEFEGEVVISELIRQDCIGKGKTIVDFGGGTGYYSLLFSQIAGKTGRVFLLDIDLTSLNYAMQTIRYNNYLAEINNLESNFSNITPLLAFSDRTGLNKESVDTVFICYVHTFHQGFPDFVKPVLWDRDKSKQIREKLVDHIDSQQSRTIKELHSILKPEGKLILIEDMEMSGMPYRLDREGVAKLFEKNGFKLYFDSKSLCKQEPQTQDIHFLFFKKTR